MQADTDWLLQSEAVSIPDEGPSPLPSARSSTLSDWQPGGGGRGSEEVSGSVWGDGRSSRGDGSSRARSSPLSGHEVAAAASGTDGDEAKDSPASSASISPTGSSRPSSGCPRSLQHIGGMSGRGGGRGYNPAVGPPSAAVRTTPSTAAGMTSAASNISGTVSLFRPRSSTRSWIRGWEGTDEVGDACLASDDDFGSSPAVGLPPFFGGGGRASSLPSELPSHLIYYPPAGTATGNNGVDALEVLDGLDDGCGDGTVPWGEGSDGGSEGATGLWRGGEGLAPSRQATASVPSSRASGEAGAGPLSAQSRGQVSGVSSCDGNGGQGAGSTAGSKKEKEKKKQKQGATSELLHRLSSWAWPAAGSSEKEQPEKDKVKGSDRKKSILVRGWGFLYGFFRSYSKECVVQ